MDDARTLGTHPFTSIFAFQETSDFSKDWCSICVTFYNANNSLLLIHLIMFI
jgi:hypothetical protein